MKRISILILIAIFLIGACVPEKGIEVHQAWMRPTAEGENGAVYFVIHNHSSTADELLGASSDAAEAIEIHESKMNGEVMEMRQLGPVPLKSFAEIEFAPGGLHLMLIHLKKEVKASDEIEVTLHFKNFEDLKLRVPVRDSPAPEEEH